MFLYCYIHFSYNNTTFDPVKMAPIQSIKRKFHCISDSEHDRRDENSSLPPVNTDDTGCDYSQPIQNRCNIKNIINGSKLTSQFVNIYSPVQCSSCSRCNGGGCSRCF